MEISNYTFESQYDSYGTCERSVCKILEHVEFLTRMRHMSWEYNNIGDSVDISFVGIYKSYAVEIIYKQGFLHYLSITNMGSGNNILNIVGSHIFTKSVSNNIESIVDLIRRINFDTKLDTLSEDAMSYKSKIVSVYMMNCAMNRTLYVSYDSCMGFLERLEQALLDNIDVKLIDDINSKASVGGFCKRIIEPFSIEKVGKDLKVIYSPYLDQDSSFYIYIKDADLDGKFSMLGSILWYVYNVNFDYEKTLSIYEKTRIINLLKNFVDEGRIILKDYTPS